MNPFDLDDIINLASNTSFERGEDYYNSGSVGKIIRTGNKFQGFVSGTYKYNVTLNITNDELNFHCSCPYDYEGICKHEVAFALAILDGKYIEELRSTSLQEVNPDLFNKCFKNTDTQKKIDFLKQLLDKDTDLQNQFIVFTKSKSDNLDSITGINIDSLKQEIYNELTSIDFDDIVENNDYYDNGYYDDEGYIDASYDEIRNIFNPHKNKAIEYIKKGNLLDASRIILGLYEGSQNLPEPESDYDIFGESYNATVLDILVEIFNDITIEIEQIVKSDELIIKVLDLIIGRINLYGDKKNRNKDGKEEEAIEYNLKVFEKLFKSLIINKTTAEYFYKIIKENNLDGLNTAYVFLKVAEFTENEELWLSTAESFAEFEEEITEQLLGKYMQKKQVNNFNRIAELAFNKWPDRFDLFLISNLDKENQKKLYIKSLKNYTVHKCSVKHYKELREYLNENEKKEFVDNISKNFNHVFYIQLLNIEMRYHDILTFVKKQQDSIYDFEKIIAPIVNIYPLECFDMIKNKCDLAFKSYNRNRKTYQQMVGWLKVMMQIESKQTETQHFIKSFYEYKPNLPALKDEIKKARLIT